MRPAVLLLAPLVIAATPPPAHPAPRTDNLAQLPRAAGQNCSTRIEQVRDERGLPKLQRDNASADEPLFIAAVDRRIDGCEVLVMLDNTNDVRPVPAPQDKARMRPAH